MLVFQSSASLIGSDYMVLLIVWINQGVPIRWITGFIETTFIPWAVFACFHHCCLSAEGFTQQIMWFWKLRSHLSLNWVCVCRGSLVLLFHAFSRCATGSSCNIFFFPYSPILCLLAIWHVLIVIQECYTCLCENLVSRFFRFEFLVLGCLQIPSTTYVYS